MARKNSGKVGSAQLDRATVASVPAPAGPMGTYDLGKMEFMEAGPSTSREEMMGPGPKRHPSKEMSRHMKSEAAMSRAQASKKGKRKSDIRANVWY